MSEFDLEEITDRAGTGAPNFTYGFNINGSDSGLLGATHTVGTTEPSSPSNGDAWWNTGNDSYNVYIDGEWKGWLGDTYSTSNAWSGDRAIVFTNAQYNDIQYFDITSPGNASDFGDMYAGERGYGAAGGNKTRAIFACGFIGGSSYNIIEYVTPSTTGNSTDFGDNTLSRNSLAGCSNGTRMLMGGGGSNTVDYITVDTTGNATDFGDLSASGSGQSGGAGEDATRAVFGGGIGGATNTIDYFTFASPGNATDFGDLTRSVNANAACSDATRVCFTGGSSSNTIDYITTQTTGNATDFGDLNYNFQYGGACENDTRGVAINSYDYGSSSSDIDYFTIQTTGNATDFGDMITSAASTITAPGATSGSPS